MVIAASWVGEGHTITIQVRVESLRSSGMIKHEQARPYTKGRKEVVVVHKSFLLAGGLCPRARCMTHSAPSIGIPHAHVSHTCVPTSLSRQPNQQAKSVNSGRHPTSPSSAPPAAPGQP
jgi:hypothetical protein